MSVKLNAIQRALRFTGLEHGFGHMFAAIFVGFTIGQIIDRSDTSSMTFYRDRSALYGRNLKEGEAPSWPTKENYVS